MTPFWDYSVWDFMCLLMIMLSSMLLANILKRRVAFFKRTLIPTAVLGGMIVLLISFIYSMIAGKNEDGVYYNLFQTSFFGSYGLDMLYKITYHCLALGFIANTLKSGKNKFTRERNREIFNSGVTTVSSYLIQGILGLSVTIIVAMFSADMLAGAGILLPFGFGQGTGQAMNYGVIYQTDYGFNGGQNFGLSIAALGFLCASIGGVYRLNKIKKNYVTDEKPGSEMPDAAEIMSGSNEVTGYDGLDKATIQLALIGISYAMAYGLMYLIGSLVPGLRATIYGFNFLFAVLAAVVTKKVVEKLKQKGVIRRDYISPYLMERMGGLFFDIMIVSGFAAIQLELLAKNWYVLLIMAVLGMTVTYLYNMFVAKKLFPKYRDEQFLVMYGMLTGTASTGIMLLHEIDKKFETPASDNLIYQNFPAIVFGFPMMLLGTLSPKEPVITLIILTGLFAVMNLILFRSFIFKKRKTK